MRSRGLVASRRAVRIKHRGLGETEVAQRIISAVERNGRIDRELTIALSSLVVCG